jgi:hypothetical protein
MNMNCLPNIFFNKQNEFRSVRTPTDRKKVQLTLLNIVSGIYHYEIQFMDGQQSKGNITIQK